MIFSWQLVVCAIGLAFCFEGILYALMAERMPEVLRQIAALPVAHIRTMGLLVAIVGFGLVLVARLL